MEDDDSFVDAQRKLNVEVDDNADLHAVTNLFSKLHSSTATPETGQDFLDRCASFLLAWTLDVPDWAPF